MLAESAGSQREAGPVVPAEESMLPTLGTAMAQRKQNIRESGSTLTPLQFFKKKVCTVSLYPKILLLNTKVCKKKKLFYGKICS